MALDAYAIKAGATSKVLLVQVRDLASDRPKTGLGADTAGVSAAYVREGEARVHRIELVPGRLGEYAAGALVEVDGEALPGVYQFGAPNDMLAPGAARVVLMLRVPGAAVEPIDIDLVGYDPEDPVRLGMGAISPQARIEALRGAFPRLTQRELELDQALREKD